MSRTIYYCEEHQPLIDVHARASRLVTVRITPLEGPAPRGVRCATGPGSFACRAPVTVSVEQREITAEERDALLARPLDRNDAFKLMDAARYLDPHGSEGQALAHDLRELAERLTRTLDGRLDLPPQTPPRLDGAADAGEQFTKGQLHTATQVLTCDGDGHRPIGRGRCCQGLIGRGWGYLEIGTPPAVTRHCLPCARAFFAVDRGRGA